MIKVVLAGGEGTSISQWDISDIIKFTQKTQTKYPNNRKVSITGDIPNGKVKTTKPYINNYNEKTQ